MALTTHTTNDPSFMMNGLTIHLRDEGPCWFVDPGLPPHAEEMIAYAKSHSLTPEAVLLTHGHADHIAGVDEVLAAFPGIAVYMAREDWPCLTEPNENLSVMFGTGLVTGVTDPKDLVPGEELHLDGTPWQILDTSGHSPGGRSFYCAEHKVAIVGDALFSGGVGRVDFHHSDGKRLMENISANLMTLPGDTRVISGHGPDTTIGTERKTNPYVTGRVPLW